MKLKELLKKQGIKNALPSQAMHFNGNTVTTLQVTCCKGTLFP